MKLVGSLLRGRKEEDAMLTFSESVCSRGGEQWEEEEEVEETEEDDENHPAQTAA